MMSKANPLIFALLSTLSYSQTTFARFPGRSSTLLSPDRRYVLRNASNNREPYHSSIFLTNKRTGKSLKIYEYGRHATVAWAPDSKRFSLNDYAGSDFTNTYIVPTDGTSPRIDVQKEIYAKARDLANGHHEYFGVARWLDNRRVIVHHWGYGDGAMFCQCYVYTLNGPVAKCAKQPKIGDPEQGSECATP